MAPIDQVQLHFNPQTLRFQRRAGAGDVRRGTGPQGRGLSLRPENPQGPGTGPVRPPCAVPGHDLRTGLDSAATAEHRALGMILVSSCPAGHISNFLVHFSRGNTACRSA